MVTVALRINHLPNVANATRKTLPFSVVEGGGIIIRSQLDPELPLNDHLVWLWGMLMHERRYLKSLQSEGAVITVVANSTPRTIEVKANGAEMLHLLNANLVIDTHNG